MLGHFLGQISWVQHNLEKAVILVILRSISPMFFHWLGSRRAKRAEALAVRAAAAAAEPEV